jgi:hypothetical protein
MELPVMVVLATEVLMVPDNLKQDLGRLEEV